MAWEMFFAAAGFGSHLVRFSENRNLITLSLPAGSSRVRKSRMYSWVPSMIFFMSSPDGSSTKAVKSSSVKGVSPDASLVIRSFSHISSYVTGCVC